ncbi:hypothetical protein [Laedolimicola ammoniilytica]|uniref:Uncharacterized protein n=1 Tax=Laedolimicola ammoniilytica TaxID=2981771 RepID=A0ABT2RSP3_9FIRM|nr:hypothetical protein [Laedolimicola ammoniilytica]MCU6695325.1 hypothetical protein [Laedolimicola ammoniilytica]SCG91934.1 Uncharacterised protein [uncultured Clostridium sp.]
MKKKNIQIICNIISALLAIAFVIKTIINFFQYDTLLNAAPFYVWILVNALFLLIPASIVFVVGIIVSRKY